MNRDSYSDQPSRASFQPRSPQPVIEPTFGQPAHHSSSTSNLGSNWLNKASGWVADKFQTAQNFVNGSGEAIAPDQVLPALRGTAISQSQTDPTNQPLVGVIDAGFGANEHGSQMVEAIQKQNPQAKIWQGGGVGTGGGLESLVEFVDVAKATGQTRAVANLSFDLTEVHPDGSVSTRAQLTAEEQSALAYARDNGVLVVASSGNQGGAMSALGQASQPSDNLIVVGAANGSDRASYSSYGNGLDLVADVGAAGTSLAAAKVTGAIANIWSANPGVSGQQVNQILTATATDLKTPGRDAETGAGLLNATGAIDLATHTTPKSIVFSGAQLVQQAPKSVAGATWESRNGSVASERTNRPIEGDGPRISAQSASAQRAVAPRRRAAHTPPRPAPPTAAQRANELHRAGERTPLPPRPPAPPTPAQRAAGQRAAGQRANELHRAGERTPLPPRPAPPTPAPQATNPLDVRRAEPAAPENPHSRSTPAQRRAGERAPLSPPRPAPPTSVPDTSGYEVVSEVGHTLLDLVGVTPVGFLADGANAVWYAVEGDYENAAVSAAGILPGGEVATGARLVRRASELVNRASEVYGAVEEARGIVEGVSEVANGNFNSGDAAFTLAETVFSSRGRRDRPTDRPEGNDRNGELNAGGASNTTTPQNPPRNGGSPSRSGSEADARVRRDDRGRLTADSRDHQPAAVGGRRGDQTRPSTAAATPSVTTGNQNSRADSAPAPRSGGSGNSNQPLRKPPTGGYDGSNNNGLPAGNGGNFSNSGSSPNQSLSSNAIPSHPSSPAQTSRDGSSSAPENQGLRYDSQGKLRDAGGKFAPDPNRWDYQPDSELSPDGKKHLVYVFKDKETGEVRYVGRTSGESTKTYEQILKDRLRGHHVYKGKGEYQDVGMEEYVNAEIVAVQDNALANKGAEDVIYEYYLREARNRNAGQYSRDPDEEGRQQAGIDADESLMPRKVRPIDHRLMEEHGVYRALINDPGNPPVSNSNQPGEIRRSKNKITAFADDLRDGTMQSKHQQFPPQ